MGATLSIAAHSEGHIMTMLQITIPSAPRFRASVTLKNFPKLMEKFSKVSGKARKPTIKADKRLFPVSGQHMNTKDYVKAFWKLNFTAAAPEDCEAFYEPLSEQPQEWPQEPLYEVSDDAAVASNQIDLDGPESLPSWLTSGVPPAWLQGA